MLSPGLVYITRTHTTNVRARFLEAELIYECRVRILREKEWQSVSAKERERELVCWGRVRSFLHISSSYLFLFLCHSPHSLTLTRTTWSEPWAHDRHTYKMHVWLCMKISKITFSSFIKYYLIHTIHITCMLKCWYLNM